MMWGPSSISMNTSTRRDQNKSINWINELGESR